MKKLISLSIAISIIYFFNSNALAFWNFFKSTSQKQDKKFFIQNQTSINKKFQSQNGVQYDLRLTIDIPSDRNGSIMISAFYDEASEQGINDISWIIIHKTKETKIPRTAVKQEVNKVYEQLAINQDPGLSYDRITEEKHIINKYFLFPRKPIIPDVINLKTIRANYLEITFADESIKRIAINKYIYPFSDTEAKQVELPVERTKPPKEPKVEKQKIENKSETQNRIKSETGLQPPTPANSNNPYLNLNGPPSSPEESSTAKELEELKNELNSYMQEVYSEDDEDTMDSEF